MDGPLGCLVWLNRLRQKKYTFGKRKQSSSSNQLAAMCICVCVSFPDLSSR